jgi:hypothetical protein
LERLLLSHAASEGITEATKKFVLLECSLCDPIAEMAVEQSSDGGANGTAVMQGGYPGCSENSESAVKGELGGGCSSVKDNVIQS